MAEEGERRDHLTGVAMPFEGAVVVRSSEGRWALDNGAGHQRSEYTDDEVVRGAELAIHGLAPKDRDILRLLAIRRKMGRKRFEAKYGARVPMDLDALGHVALERYGVRLIRRFGYVPEGAGIARIASI